MKLNTNMNGEYCSPEQATHLRVFEDFDGYAIDAADDSGNYTEVVWTHWNDKLLTKDCAIARAGAFAKQIGRPDLAAKVMVSGKLLKPTLFERLKSLLRFD